MAETREEKKVFVKAENLVDGWDKTTDNLMAGLKAPL